MTRARGCRVRYLDVSTIHEFKIVPFGRREDGRCSKVRANEQRGDGPDFVVQWSRCVGGRWEKVSISVSPSSPNGDLCWCCSQQNLLPQQCGRVGDEALRIISHSMISLEHSPGLLFITRCQAFCCWLEERAHRCATVIFGVVFSTVSLWSCHPSMYRAFGVIPFLS